MARLRLLFLGLSFSVLVWAVERFPAQVLAQVAQPGAANREIGLGGLNLAERWLEQSLKDAKKKLAAGENSEAARRIQQLLTQPQDGFFRPDGDQTGRYASLKRTAATLLRDAAPEVLIAYELQFGAEAREKLDVARSRHDVPLAQEVTQRYLHTNAGAEACYWLATHQMDRGDYFTAVQYLQRLRSLPAGIHFEPRLALRLAVCWSRLGTPEKAMPLIQNVLSKSREPIRIGTQSLAEKATSDQILTWIRSLSQGEDGIPGVDSTGWRLARGTPDRNPHRRSSPPVARPLWDVAMSSWSVLNRKTLKPETISISPSLVACGKIHQEAAVTPLPSTIPLIVDGLVITRYADHIAAVDLRTGEEVWNTFERDRMFHEVRNSLGSPDRITSSFNNWNLKYPEIFRILIRQRTWEDLTFGTLSSDGELVFGVEDLGFMNPLISEIGNTKPHAISVKDYNRLCAYDVKSGMLRWELGGANSTINLDQAGAFFLGPPLPAGRQLYCLAEQQGFVQLLVLDATTGEELWSQNLAQSNEDLLTSSNRRRAGITPSMMGDLLVCATGTGYVVAVDTGTKSLAWAYQYADSSQVVNNRNPFIIGRGGRLGVRGEPIDFNPERPAITNEWQDGSPILTETHVILTPRDSNELHCLSLEDGSFQWRVPRGEGQYVAAVRDGLVIVVNKQSVEALKLEDGKPAWPAPIPVINQTGRGITTNTHLVLPLVTGQVASIELQTGRKYYSRVRGSDQEPLGNLVSGSEIVLSQSPNELIAFRTLESVYPEAVARLKANPQDAEALAQRGEYQLSLSRITEGQADLRASLRLQKTPDATFLLFESLLEGLQTDFASHRQFAEEAEQLSQTSTQKSVLYRAWAVGLRKLGEFHAAFEMLEKLNRADLGEPELERIDGHHAVRRDYWIRNEAQQILASTNQADRNQFQIQLKARLDAAKANATDEELRQLTRFLGWGPLADEARLALVQRLLSRGYSLEAEQILAGLRRSSERTIASQAVGLMVVGLIKLQRPDEAVGLLPELEGTYADLPCVAGKTGRQVANELRSAMTPGMTDFENWPIGRVEVHREALEKSENRMNFEIPIEGDGGPFYGDMQMRIESGALRFLGQTGWGTVRFAMPLNELMPLSNPTAIHAQIRNHLILLNTGPNVVAIDTLTDGKTIRAQRIWSSSLMDGPAIENNQFFPAIRQRPGIGRIRFPGMDRWRNVMGTVGAIQDDSVCVLRGRHLILLDILTGETLWKRSNMVPGSEIFGDQETVFVIEPVAAPSQPVPQVQPQTVARRIRRSDGTELGQVDVPDMLSRIQVFGDRILSASNDPRPPGTNLILKMRDLTRNQAVWEHSFEQRTQVSLIGDTEIAVLEPSGLVTFLHTETGRILWTKQLQRLEKPKEFSIFPDGKRLLLLRDEFPPLPLKAPVQHFMAVNASQQNLMYGQADCLDRATGNVLWSHRVENYALDGAMPNASPIWFFTVRTFAQLNQRTEIRMLALDKRSGRVAMQSEETSYGHGFEFAIDPKEKQIDITLLGSQQPIRHRLTLTDLPFAAVAPAPEKSAEVPPEKKPEK